jgi:beta-mannosidase
MGLMVSQDFLLACANYPEDDPAFTAGLNKEFSTAVRLLRNHPSLVFWSGDNELGLNTGPQQDWNLKKFQQQVTAPMMRELDPSRPFRPTSPFGGSDENNSPLAGDCHRNAQMSEAMINSDMRDYRTLIDQTTGRFISEEATGGSPPKRTLLRFMTETDLASPWMWEFHTSDNPYIGRTLGLTIGQIFKREAAQLYGDPAGDVDRRIRQEEYLQYEFTRLGMESARRRKFWCSGIQFWMFNDCWPAIGWSLVDYWGGRKASWYGAAAGCRSVIAAQEVTTNKICWWVCNDRLQPVEVTLDVRVQPWSGAARWTKSVKLTVPANASVNAIELPRDGMKQTLGDDAALVCDLKYVGGSDCSWWFPGLPREMHLPSAKLTVSQKCGEDEGSVTIYSENWARVVTLDAAVDFSDNYFELMPGETRTITWKSPVRPFAGKIHVSCWNP